MGTAYSPQAWTDLFVASAGASAALTGLLFVAVSVNISDILANPGLPERALQTLLLLLGAVVVSLLGLIPGQSDTALGIELLGIGLGFSAWIFVLLARAVPATREYVHPVLQVALLLPGTAPLVLGGISMLAHTGGGLYWIVAGVIGALCGASVNAWVLLVEILR